MSQLDLAVFLVAGIIGAGAGYPNTPFKWGGSLSWAIIAVWALLKLLHVLA